MAAHSRFVEAVRQAGRGLGAEAVCRHFLRQFPRDPLALQLLALSLADQGKLTEGLGQLAKAAAADPEFAEVHYNRGQVLAQLGRVRESLAAFDATLRLRPDLAEAWNGRGRALAALLHLDDALTNFDRALALRPNSVSALYNRGTALLDLNRFADAIAAFDRVLALDPRHAMAAFNRAIALAEMGHASEAASAYARVAAIDPAWPGAAGQVHYEQRRICDWANAPPPPALEAAVLSQPGAFEPFATLVLTDSPACAQASARAFMTSRWPNAAASRRPRGRKHDRIRLAYFSSDFHDHATAHLTAGLFERHDRTAFEVIGVEIASRHDDAMSARLHRAFDRFVDATAMPDGDVVAATHNLEFDIAIDLNGHTKHARQGIFAARAAPLQVNYLGYPGTSGAVWMDYIIADRTVVPADHERFYDEAVVCLPESYQPNDSQRPIAPRAFTRAELGLPPDGFVFACFNTPRKFAPDVFDRWMRLLAAVPGSTLWLLDAGELAAANLLAEATKRGVAPERLVFARYLPADEHLARHRCADLFLDTLPYNAHTTASDALWAGVPMVTCLGNAFQGRVGASLVRAVGLPELVTGSLDDYEALALRLAREPGALHDLRTRLNAGRAAAPLFDTARICRHLESAYRTMWERHRRGEAPAPFEVPPYDR